MATNIWVELPINTGPVAVTGPFLTDAELRASPVAISGTVTADIGTTGGLALDTTVATLLTDAQLRASPVPISGTVTSNIGTTGGLALDATVATLLTDTQLRASPVPISGTITANQGTSPWIVSGSISTSPDVNIHDGTGLSIGSTSGALNTFITNSSIVVTGPLTDAQLRASAVSVTANAGTNLNTSALALESTQSAQSILIGSVTETAPTNDTASSGLNGRLQRIAQRLTSLLALIPASLGQKTMANSLAVTVASDQSAIPSSQSGTWNITNVSGTVSLPTGASTAANQSTGNTSLSSIDAKLTTTNASLATIDAGIPAALGETTKSASMPVVPASDYIWKEAFFTSTPLGISGVYNSGVIAMDGYNTFELNINADQQSAINNILVIFYEDALGTKIVDTNFYDYLGTAVPEQIIIPVQGNYLVVQYTNGTTAQGSFILQGILKNSNQQATATTLYHKEGFLQQVSHLYLHTKNYNTGRLPEVRKRISVEFFAQGVTSGSTLRTNNAGFTFYLETLIISVVNTSTTIGSFALQDGTDTTDRIPFTIEPAITFANRGKLFETIHFGDDPKPFGSDVRTIFTAGTLTVSIYCKGYEEIT